MEERSEQVAEKDPRSCCTDELPSLHNTMFIGTGVSIDIIAIVGVARGASFTAPGAVGVRTTAVSTAIVTAAGIGVSMAPIARSPGIDVAVTCVGRPCTLVEVGGKWVVPVTVAVGEAVSVGNVGMVG